MTIDEILARKREVLALRKEETDTFNLFFLNEELHDLNGQLRSLRGGYRAQSATNSGLSMDYARYADWLAGERDDDMREAHRVYIDAVKRSADVLSERQREIFDLWRDGMRPGEIARALDVDPSTISRTLARGKRRLREEAEDLAKALRLADMPVFDLADGDVARVILSCLTNRQAVCVYLYYGEWLNLRECGELLGVDHTAVLRAVRRGLRAIRDTLRCETFTLDNVDALSELAYELYLTQAPEAAEEAAPRDRRGAWARQKLGRRARKRTACAPVECLVRTSDGLVSAAGTAHHSLERPMGKLLRLLFELRGRRGPLYSWLAGLFAKVTKRKKEERPANKSQALK